LLISHSQSKVIGRFSVSFIILSLVSYCLSTVVGACPFESYCRSYKLKMFVANDKDESVITISAAPDILQTTILDYIDYTCITWFTWELVIRFAVSPEKWEFCKSPLNWIDFLANTWFYANLLFNKILNNAINPMTAHPIWDLLGTIRIMRLFKFINHHKGLKIIIASLKASAGILRLLVFFVCVAVILFASLIFYCERMATSSTIPVKFNSRVGSGSIYNQNSQENDFLSIAEAIWFAIISLTTVGFGDMVPRTPFGEYSDMHRSLGWSVLQYLRHICKNLNIFGPCFFT
jgi:potassium voltage-gated channel Shaw-related subfamily C protein 1